MTQITPVTNQTSLPVAVGLLGTPPRIAFFCPSTGLLYDNVFDVHYDWTATGSLTMTFSLDQAMTPAGYTGLSVQAQSKPFSTVAPSITPNGGAVTLTRAFPTSTTSSVASFNVWVNGEAPDGQAGIVAWHDPTWPVGKLGSGGPDKLAAEQTNYYYMNGASQTISLHAMSNSTGDWLQTEYGAIVGSTMVISPPQGAAQGEALTVTVEVVLATGPVSTQVQTTVGTAASGALRYSIGGESRSLGVQVLAEPATPPTPVS